MGLEPTPLAAWASLVQTARGVGYCLYILFILSFIYIIINYIFYNTMKQLRIFSLNDGVTSSRCVERCTDVFRQMHGQMCRCTKYKVTADGSAQGQGLW